MKGLKLLLLLHPNHHRSEKHVVLIVIHGLRGRGNCRGCLTRKPGRRAESPLILTSRRDIDRLRYRSVACHSWGDSCRLGMSKFPVKCLRLGQWFVVQYLALADQLFGGGKVVVGKN